MDNVLCIRLELNVVYWKYLEYDYEIVAKLISNSTLFKNYTYNITEILIFQKQYSKYVYKHNVFKWFIHFIEKHVIKGLAENL